MKIVKDKVDYNEHFPYDKIHTKIVDDNRISALAFRIFIVLVNCDEHKYKPSIKSLSKQFGVKSRTIDRAVAQLKSYGYITASGTRKDTTWYIHPITVSG